MVRGLAGGLAVAVALTACTSTATPGGAPANSVIVGVDLPFQGPSASTSEQTWNALALYLERQGGKVGKFSVQLKRYDDATVARQTWDEATCVANARDHLTTPPEVAVIGMPNAGCLKAELPLLNKDPGGAMLAVSYSVSDPGLTKQWRPGEPDRYAPSGSRSFARVITTDDAQAAAVARYGATELRVHRCLVLNNGEIYAARLAKAFADEARLAGLEIVGEQTWDRSSASYADLFTPYSGSNVDCVYLAGNFDDNGGQLIADKVAALGDNTSVRLLLPDGFAGYPALMELPAAQGAVVTTVGLPEQSFVQLTGKAAELRAAYQERFSTPLTAQASYAVLALQMVLAAVAGSDGTRAGVRGAVFGGAGVSVPAEVAVVGKAVRIDPLTGDVDARDVSLMVIRDGQQSVVATRVAG